MSASEDEKANGTVHWNPDEAQMAEVLAADFVAVELSPETLAMMERGGADTRLIVTNTAGKQGILMPGLTAWLLLQFCNESGRSPDEVVQHGLKVAEEQGYVKRGPVQ